MSATTTPMRKPWNCPRCGRAQPRGSVKYQNGWCADCDRQRLAKRKLPRIRPQDDLEEVLARVRADHAYEDGEQARQAANAERKRQQKAAQEQQRVLARTGRGSGAYRGPDTLLLGNDWYRERAAERAEAAAAEAARAREAELAEIARTMTGKPVGR